MKENLSDSISVLNDGMESSVCAKERAIIRIALFANTDWYLYNFRMSLARALREQGHEVVLMSPPGTYSELLREQGWCWISVPMKRRSLNPLREYALIRGLRQLFRRERFDLVHTFTLKCSIYGSLAALAAGRPLRVNSIDGMGYVFTSHESKAQLLRPVVLGLLRLALVGRKVRLMVQNPDDAAFFRRGELVDPANVRLVSGSGVDCTRFAATPSARGARLRVLLPARLLWDKGLAEYVEAARILLAKGRAIDFLIAGTPDLGNPAAVPEANVKQWVAAGLVTWLGHVDDMVGLLRSVDVVVLPSYREGLPKSLIEAAACGLPLVTTDVPGCREVVTDGVDGLMVPVKDAVALAAAIERLADDPALCARLGAAARAQALAVFDERIVNAKTLDIYRELLGSEAV
jgi:glycosyltransferase involved in cell wall biosynthesis